MLLSKTLRAASAAALFAFSLAGHAAETLGGGLYSSLVVFGDSLSDSGNNQLVLGNSATLPTGNTYVPAGAPYLSGTYSNGPVWVNSFASNLGLASAALPSLAGGGNYAAGGARTNDSLIYPPSASTQVNSFLAGGTALPSGGLYVIAVGGNDVRDAVGAVAGGAPLSTIQTAAVAYAMSVGSMVDSLQARGAQHIIVWDSPDVGKTPAALAVPGASFLASQVAGAFNQALFARLTGEAGVTIFDVFGFVGGVVANPAAYGLSNVTDACGAVINACSSSLSTSLFYDGIHPTAAGHAVLAQAMTTVALAAAVPEPSSWAMLALGLVAVLQVRRVRGQRQA